MLGTRKLLAVCLHIMGLVCKLALVNGKRLLDRLFLLIVLFLIHCEGGGWLDGECFFMGRDFVYVKWYWVVRSVY